MKLIDKIYKTITFLCALVLFGACDNDKWAEVELDSTPVYELTYLKNVETGKTGEVSKFSVYRELFDLIAWKNDYQTLRMNKIEFFAESSEAPSELPEWLKSIRIQKNISHSLSMKSILKRKKLSILKQAIKKNRK